VLLFADILEPDDAAFVALSVFAARSLVGTAASTPDSCYAGPARATRLASWKQNSATRQLGLARADVLVRLF